MYTIIIYHWKELTHVCSLCLNCTPISSSHSRHRSQPDIVLSASCQSTKNGRVLWRKAWDDVLTTQGSSPMYPVLKTVLRNELITLWSGPGYLQSWSSCQHCLGQRQASDLRRNIWDWQKKLCQIPLSQMQHIHAVLLCIVTQERQAEWHVHSITRDYSQAPGESIPSSHSAWTKIILMLYSIISDINHFHHTNYPWAHPNLMLTTLTEVVVVYWHHQLCNCCNCLSHSICNWAVRFHYTNNYCLKLSEQ